MFRRIVKELFTRWTPTAGQTLFPWWRISPKKTPITNVYVICITAGFVSSNEWYWRCCKLKGTGRFQVWANQKGQHQLPAFRLFIQLFLVRIHFLTRLFIFQKIVRIDRHFEFCRVSNDAKIIHELWIFVILEFVFLLFQLRAELIN